MTVRAYVNVESDKSMCVIMIKCNTVTRDGLLYTKYVTCSIALIQLTKRFLKHGNYCSENTVANIAKNLF